MATLQARIEGYVGAITGSTSAIQDAMSSEARILIDALPAFDLIQDGASNSVTTTAGQDAFPVDNVRILDVMVSYPGHPTGSKGPYRARKISRSESGRMLDPDGLYYRKPSIVYNNEGIVRDPVYFIEKIENTPPGDTFSHVRTIPEPSVTSFGGFDLVTATLEYVPYPSISLSDANLYEIPKKILQALVFYGAIEELTYRISNSITKLASAFYTSPTAPVFIPPPLPDSPSIAPGSVSAQVVTGITGLDTDIVELGTIFNPSLPILSLDFSPVTTALANDDFEKSRNELEKIQQQISEYASQSSVILDEWKGSEVQSYLSGVESKITQARINAELVGQYAGRVDQANLSNAARALEAEYREYELELQRYQVSFTEQARELDLFSARVQDEAQAYTDKASRTSTEIQSNQGQLVSLQGLYQQQLQKLGLVAQPNQ